MPLGFALLPVRRRRAVVLVRWGRKRSRLRAESGLDYRVHEGRKQGQQGEYEDVTDVHLDHGHGQGAQTAPHGVLFVHGYG